MNRPVEGRHLVDAGTLRASYQVRLGKVEAIYPVHLDGGQQLRLGGADNRLQREERPNRLSDLFARRFVERLNNVNGLSNNKIGQEQLRFDGEVNRRPDGHFGRIASLGVKKMRGRKCSPVIPPDNLDAVTGEHSIA